MRSCEIFIEGIGAARAVEKIVQGGVPVLAARVQKKGVTVRVDGKHREKVFAILRGSCYNGKNVRFAGLLRGVRLLAQRAGLLIGAAAFVSMALFFQSRVLRIEVVGSGAYYRSEVLSVLSQSGTGLFSPPPADRAQITAEILSLPRVSFCSLSHEGGVLTVCVEVSDDALPLAGGPLLIPADGVVETLTVLAGTARVAVGDAVKAGDVAVENAAYVGEEKLSVTVIAGIAVRVAVDREYAGEEDDALAQAYLDYGGIDGIRTEKTETGWRVTGTALVYAALNLG